MDITTWGPHGWGFFHAVTFAYPQNPDTLTKQQYAQFFDSIGNVLPCGICRQHFADMLKKYPIDLTSRDTLTRWLVDRHNQVNQRLGKPIMSYDQAVAMYTQPVPAPTPTPSKPDSHANNKYILIGVAVALAVVLIAWVGFLAVKRHQIRSPM